MPSIADRTFRIQMNTLYSQKEFEMEYNRALSPELNLVVRMLAQALSDVRWLGRRGQEALDWIRGVAPFDDPDYFLSCESCCEALDLLPEAVQLQAGSLFGSLGKESSQPNCFPALD